MSSDANPSATQTLRKLFLSRTFSNASLNSVATTVAILPEYCTTSLEGNETVEASTLSNLSCHHSEHVSHSTERRALPQIPSPTTSNTGRSAVPPRYSVISANPRCMAVNHIEHSFPLGGGHKSWATLYTFTPESVPGLVQEQQATKRNIPRFLGGGDITGMLELNLEGTQTIQQIIITVQGRIISGSLAAEVQKFLNYKHIIWHQKMGDPRQLSTRESPTRKSDGKLTGSHQIPFSFPFPVHIDPGSYSTAHTTMSPFPLAADSSSSLAPPPSLLSNGEKGKSRPSALNPASVQPAHPLSLHLGNLLVKGRSVPSQPKVPVGSQSVSYPTPASFAKGYASVSVQYELLVRIVHGRFRLDSQINTNISYLPILVPPPFSLKRREAYEANALIPGPMQDPEGWFALPKSIAKGKLGGIGGRQVRIGCELHLAKPLSYTRSTVIPCYLNLSSDDSTALNSLSTPKSPYVRLMRRLQYFSLHVGKPGTVLDQAFGVYAYNPHQSGVVPPAAYSSGETGSLNVIEHEIGTAVWWVPPKDIVQDTYARHLEGEIHLPHDLQPSSSCPLFSVEYFVEMLPLVSGFEPEADPNIQSDPRMRVLSSCRVEIATSHPPDGSIAVAFTEPSNSLPRSSGSQN